MRRSIISLIILSMITDHQCNNDYHHDSDFDRGWKVGSGEENSKGEIARSKLVWRKNGFINKIMR